MKQVTVKECLYYIEITFSAGCCIDETEEDRVIKKFASPPWKTLLPVKKLSAHKRHYYEGGDIENCGVITHVRLTLAPDGGISRMRLWGSKQSPVTAKL